MVSLVHYSMLVVSLQYLVSRRKMAWHGARANGSDGEIDGALRCRQKR